jgi:hypothetical protein
MNQSIYSSATANMVVSIEKFITNKYVKDFIPEQILKSLELLVIFFKDAKYTIFIEGKILSLTIWNVIRWYKFAKLAHKFVKDLYEIWK